MAMPREWTQALEVMQELDDWLCKHFTGGMTPLASVSITSGTTSISIAEIEVWNSEYQIDDCPEDDNELSRDQCIRNYVAQLNELIGPCHHLEDLGVESMD